MSATQLIKHYPYTDFPNGQANISILESEILSDDAVSIKPVTVVLNSVQVDITFVTLPDAGTLAALDAIVAAHTGEGFQSSFQSTSSHDDLNGEAELEAIDSSWVDVWSYDSGPLRADKYQILYSAEHKVDIEGDGEDSELRVLIWVDAAGAYVEANFDSVQSSKFQSFSNGLVHDVENDGDRILMKMQLRKTGPGTSKGVLRRGRLVQTKAGS